jgi:hypothetical protein
MSDEKHIMKINPATNTVEFEAIDDMGEKLVGDLFALEVEFRLTVAMAHAIGDQKCLDYLIARRDVILPQIIFNHNRNPNGLQMVQVFHRYAQLVHQEKCES